MTKLDSDSEETGSDSDFENKNADDETESESDADDDHNMAEEHEEPSINYALHTAQVASKGKMRGQQRNAPAKKSKKEEK